MTHYQVLGVDPDAGIDEIRRRYRALAQERHPDRWRQGTERTEANAAAEMAAINEAWSVLSDPARRQAYDESLHPRASTTSSTPVGQSPYGPAHPPPDHAAQPIGCLVGVAGFLPWITLLAALAAIFVFTAYAGSGDDADDREGTDETDVPLIAVRDVRGSCIRTAGGIISVVDCLTTPNEGVIVAQASVGASCPGGTTEWLVRQEDFLACTEPGSGRD